MSSGEKDLFQYVLVVGLQNEAGTPKPSLEYRFPPEVEKDSLADTIVQFCFPEAEVWLDKKRLLQEKKKASESFSFVLTELDGTRKFGYCRRFIAQKQNKELAPECFCIISSLPSVSLFAQLLDIVEELRKKSASAVFSFLKSVLAKSFPNPGETLVIRTFEDQIFEIKRSDNDYALDYVSFENLFKNTKVSRVLDVFAALLTESRVILCSKSVSMLSSCVLALTGLLYPFNWQHVYIPILPKALMSYCCAPMPFLVGILASNLTELNTYPMEEVVLLDLDTGKYLRDVPDTCNFKKVLPPCAMELKANISAFLKDSKTFAGRNDLKIARAFLDFFYTCFKDYQNFFENNVFQREKFYQSREPDIEKFLANFRASQMYEMFIREREAMSKTGTLSSCVLSNTKFNETMTKTNAFIFAENEKESNRCIKCAIHVSQGSFIENNNKLYCKDCWEKKQAKKNKFRSLSNLVKGKDKDSTKKGRSTIVVPELSSKQEPAVVTGWRGSLLPAHSTPHNTAPTTFLSSTKVVDHSAPTTPHESRARPLSPNGPVRSRSFSRGEIEKRDKSQSFVSFFKPEENTAEKTDREKENTVAQLNLIKGQKRPSSLTTNPVPPASTPTTPSPVTKEIVNTAPPPPVPVHPNRPISATVSQVRTPPPKPPKPAVKKDDEASPSRLCTSCGNALPESGACGSCNKLRPKFCINCGSSLSADGVCEICSKPKPKFCIYCGAALNKGPCGCSASVLPS